MPAGSIERSLERIRTTEGAIQAWVQVSPRVTSRQGPLAGIPFGAKDIIETRGLPTEYGSPLYKGRPGSDDADIIQELTSRGAVLLGKTHTAAFAYRDPAPTRNPRNLEHTPGGSSSGSAAAVAAGMVPFAIGTQTLGSVLRPASYCGITGFKPTYGWCSMEGVLPCGPSLDTLGFFTQTPAEMLELWEALDRPSAGNLPAVLAVVDPLPEFVEPEMAVGFRGAVAYLQRAGIEIAPIDIAGELVKLGDAALHVMSYEAARVHRERFEQYGDRLGQLAPMVRGGLAMPRATYDEARAVIATSRLREQLKKTPVILGPAATGPAPLGLSFTGDARMNSPWTALGTPAISIPIPTGTRMPLGLQLTAASGEDAGLLQSAVRVYEVLSSFEPGSSS